MSAISIAMLVSATVATVLSGAALHTARELRRRLDEAAEASAGTPPLPHAAPGAPSVPAARQAVGAEIRAAVTEALAEERRRESQRAREFWAAQEAREAKLGYDLLLEGHGTEYEAVPAEPRPAEQAPLDPAQLDQAPTELDNSLLEALLEGRQSGLEGHYGTWESALFVPRQTGGTSEPAAGRNAVADPRSPDGSPRGHGSAGDDPLDSLGGGLGDPGSSGNAEPGDVPPARGTEETTSRAGEAGAGGSTPGGHPAESAERAAARRRHPSHPDFTLAGEPVDRPEDDPTATPDGPDRTDGPVLADQERTLKRLAQLADEGTALVDVRSGPLGTLDVYSFADGSTLCLAPGHRETAERLGAAIDAGLTPALLGGSGTAGTYTLTFAFGEERVYTLADRVIASL